MTDSPCQHRRGGCSFGIPGAQMTRLDNQFALQQVFRVFGGQPAAFLGDADGHNFIFFFINGVENRRRRKQRDFILAAAPTEKDANPKLFHNRPPQLLAEKLQ